MVRFSQRRMYWKIHLEFWWFLWLQVVDRRIGHRFCRKSSQKVLIFLIQQPIGPQIVMHLFRTYMDSRLPSDQNSPYGKAFTNTYFKSATGPAPKSAVYIVEAKESPPHYNLFTEEDGLLELLMGRNNLFHAIIVFLDYVKRKQLGHLG